MGVAASQNTQQPQDLDLQERVGDAGHVVLGSISRAGKTFEYLDESRDQRPEDVDNALLAALLFIGLTQANDQGKAGQ